MLRFEIANERAKVVGDRLEVVRSLAAQRSQHTFATQQGAHAMDPSSPTELSHDDRDQRDDDAKSREEPEEILSRLGTSAVGEAHVVNEHEMAGRSGNG